MSQRVNTVEVKVREKSSTAGSQAFQAEVVPDAVRDAYTKNIISSLKSGRGIW